MKPTSTTSLNTNVLSLNLRPVQALNHLNTYNKMTTIVLADDSSDSSDSDDGYYCQRHSNVYSQVTGPSAWWRRLTGQDPQYEPTTSWHAHPRRRRRRIRYRRAGTGLGRTGRLVTLQEGSSSDSVSPLYTIDDPVRGRPRYRARSVSPIRYRSPSPRRYRFHSPSPIRHYPRSGYRYVPDTRYPWDWPRRRDRLPTQSPYYRPMPPPPEPPRPAPPLPAPPMPPPRRTRPSYLRQERGDRYADSEEAKYRQEYIDLRQENIREIEYETEYKERMPDWRKGAFQYRDRESREDRIEQLQEILRGARIAADREEQDTMIRAGIV